MDVMMNAQHTPAQPTQPRPRILGTTTRAQACAQALTWQGTPFRHAHHLRGHGADCVGLLAGVYIACGVLPPDYAPEPYAQHWHAYKNEELLEAELSRLGFVARESADLAAALPGDVLAFKFGRVTSHVALYLGGGEMVHAYFGLSRVVRQPLGADFRARLRRVFVPPFYTD